MRINLSTTTKQALAALATIVLVAVLGVVLGKIAAPTAMAFWLVPGVVVGAALALMILKNPLWGVVLVSFFLPFERLGAIELPGATLRVSQIVAVIAMVAWAWWYLRSKQAQVAKNPTFYPLGAFLLVNLLSLFNALNVTRSIEVYFYTVFVVIVSLLIPNLVKNKRAVELVVNALFISTVLVCFFGLFQFLGDLAGLPTTITGLRPGYTKAIFGFPRIQSTALEPLYFANFLLIPLGIAASLFLSGVKRYRPLVLVAFLALILLCAALTLSRGGYLGIVGVAAALTLIYIKKIFRPRYINIVVATLVVVALGVAIFLRQSPDAEQAFRNYIDHATSFSSDASIDERYTFYDSALQAFNEHPLLGIGAGGFGPYVADNPLREPETGWLIVNNITLEVLAETGAIGFTFFFMFWYVLLGRSVKTMHQTTDPWLRAVHRGLFAALVGILVQYQTFSILFIMHIWFVVGLLVALQNLATRKPKSAEPETAHSVRAE